MFPNLPDSTPRRNTAAVPQPDSTNCPLYANIPTEGALQRGRGVMSSTHRRSDNK